MSENLASVDWEKLAEPIKRLKEFSRENEDIGQEIVRTVFGTNILDAVQVKDKFATGGKLLDVGCGRGAWLHEVAELYPNCSCEGIDILPVDERERRNDIHNVVFHVGDVLNGLPFEDDTFDLVVMRAMKDEFDNVAWSRLVVEIFRVLKPGGWIQIVEMGDITRIGPQGDLLIRMVRMLQALRGIEGEHGEVAENLDEYLKQAVPQADSVRKKTVPVPLGWGGDIARTTLNLLINSFLAIRPIMIVVLGESNENIEKIVREWRSECTLKRSYVNIYALTAKKSLNEPSDDTVEE